MRDLTLKSGETVTVKDKELMKVLGVTQTTLTNNRRSKTLTFKQIEKIADHYGAELSDVHMFLGFKG